MDDNTNVSIIYRLFVFRYETRTRVESHFYVSKRTIVRSTRYCGAVWPSGPSLSTLHIF